MKVFLIFGVLIFSGAIQARSLSCSVKFEDAEKWKHSTDTRTVLSLSDDQGSITEGSFEGFLKNCSVPMKAAPEDYQYYYGEYVILNAKCTDSKVVLSASNNSNRADEKFSTLRGRVAQTMNDNSIRIYRISCIDR